MNKQDFKSNDVLRQSQLDSLQADVEAADDSQMLDLDMIGAVRGLRLSPVSGTMLNLSPGASNDKNTARRALVSITQQIDFSPGGVNDPAVGNKRAISIFINATRSTQVPNPGNPTIDPEGFAYTLIVGAEVPVANPLVYPAIPSDKVLLADVERRDPTAQPHILVGDIEYDRRESAIVATRSSPVAVEIRVDTVEEAFQQILDEYSGTNADENVGAAAKSSVSGFFQLLAGTVATQLESIVVQLGDADGPVVVSSSARNSTHLTLAADTLSTQLNTLVSSLGDEAGPGPGALRVGAQAQSSGGESVIAGTVESQIGELLTSLDGKLAADPSLHGDFGAGQTISGTWTPNGTTGNVFGSVASSVYRVSFGNLPKGRTTSNFSAKASALVTASKIEMMRDSIPIATLSSYGISPSTLSTAVVQLIDDATFWIRVTSDVGETSFNLFFWTLDF